MEQSLSYESMKNTQWRAEVLQEEHSDFPYQPGPSAFLMNSPVSGFFHSPRTEAAGGKE